MQHYILTYCRLIFRKPKKKNLWVLNRRDLHFCIQGHMVKKILKNSPQTLPLQAHTHTYLSTFGSAGLEFGLPRPGINKAPVRASFSGKSRKSSIISRGLRRVKSLLIYIGHCFFLHVGCHGHKSDVGRLSLSRTVQAVEEI